jgi:hypothetical protein
MNLLLQKISLGFLTAFGPESADLSEKNFGPLPTPLTRNKGFFQAKN